MAKGVEKLYKTANGSGTGDHSNKQLNSLSTTAGINSGAQSGSLRRILLVKDRDTHESFGYGFAEFDDMLVSTPTQAVISD
jgi:hypothetical protein